MRLNPEDPRLASIEAASLLRRAKSKSGLVRDRALASLRSRRALAESEGQIECRDIYYKALEEALRAL